MPTATGAVSFEASQRILHAHALAAGVDTDRGDGAGLVTQPQRRAKRIAQRGELRVRPGIAIDGAPFRVHVHLEPTRERKQVADLPEHGVEVVEAAGLEPGESHAAAERRQLGHEATVPAVALGFVTDAPEEAKRAWIAPAPGEPGLGFDLIARVLRAVARAVLE